MTRCVVEGKVECRSRPEVSSKSRPNGAGEQEVKQPKLEVTKQASLGGRIKDAAIHWPKTLVPGKSNEAFPPF